MEIDLKDRQFINKIKKLLPDEEQQLLMIVTLLGTSGVLTEFITKEYNPSGLPVNVTYCCALTAANMITFLSDSKFAVIKNMDYEMGEQTQEQIYRKMKWVVEQLHKFLQENEKIYE